MTIEEMCAHLSDARTDGDHQPVPLIYLNLRVAKKIKNRLRAMEAVVEGLAKVASALISIRQVATLVAEDLEALGECVENYRNAGKETP